MTAASERARIDLTTLAEAHVRTEKRFPRRPPAPCGCAGAGVGAPACRQAPVAGARRRLADVAARWRAGGRCGRRRRGPDGASGGSAARSGPADDGLRGPTAPRARAAAGAGTRCGASTSQQTPTHGADGDRERRDEEQRPRVVRGSDDARARARDRRVAAGRRSRARRNARATATRRGGSDLSFTRRARAAPGRSPRAARARCACPARACRGRARSCRRRDRRAPAGSSGTTCSGAGHGRRDELQDRLLVGRAAPPCTGWPAIASKSTAPSEKTSVRWSTVSSALRLLGRHVLRRADGRSAPRDALARRSARPARRARPWRSRSRRASRASCRRRARRGTRWPA